MKRREWLGILVTAPVVVPLARRTKASVRTVHTYSMKDVRIYLGDVEITETVEISSGHRAMFSGEVVYFDKEPSWLTVIK